MTAVLKVQIIIQDKSGDAVILSEFSSHVTLAHDGSSKNRIVNHIFSFGLNIQDWSSPQKIRYLADTHPYHL